MRKTGFGVVMALALCGAPLAAQGDEDRRDDARDRVRADSARDRVDRGDEVDDDRRARGDERGRKARTRGRRSPTPIPPGHLPPPGECRVWYDDRPAGEQPPPSSCERATRLAEETGGRLVYGGREGREGEPRD